MPPCKSAARRSNLPDATDVPTRTHFPRSSTALLLIDVINPFDFPGGKAFARKSERVARALEHLPEIADAFAKGEISYSKARAMTRVANSSNESVLVHVARNGTAVHVEKLVRKYRWTQRRDAAQLAQLQHEQRNVASFFDIDGTYILNARLPPEIGAVIAKALEVAVEAVRPPGGTVSAETPLQIAAHAWKERHTYSRPNSRPAPSLADLECARNNRRCAEVLRCVSLNQAA